jgi:phosphatidylethanolamine/phosphatidyl-N-methylethanolamine N-methyltransferase
MDSYLSFRWPQKMRSKSKASSTGAGLAVQTRAFFREFITNPFAIGSLIPSSNFLARSISSELDASKIHTTVEYGPGTGAFTVELYRRFGPPNGRRLVLVEANHAFASMLLEKFPGCEVVQDVAANIRRTVAGEQRADLVVSGLPFSFLSWTETAKTIHETHAVLRQGGIFRTFLYTHTLFLPQNRRLLRECRSLFSTCNTWTESRNFPPAVVIECVK